MRGSAEKRTNLARGPRGLRGLVVCFALMQLSAAVPPAPSSGGRPPTRMIWAWERPTDLRFLGDADVGVAFYGATVVIAGRDGRAIVTRRRSPLRLADATYRMAVLRVEAAPGDSVIADRATLDAIATEARRLLALPRVRAIQLDFDARASERPAHAAIVRALRASLPAGTFLSVTTLASHCFGDPFTGASVSLPDEVVPMYFRMGSDDRFVRRALSVDDEPPRSECRASAGVADDEPAPRLHGVARRYLFLTGTLDEPARRARIDAFLEHGVPR